jgi:hypothetical protein
MRPLDTSLLRISENDPWSVYDAYEGTIIFGGNGSGKTSGSGKDLAKAFLKSGFGGIVLTVKVDEADRWSAYLNQSGRSADLISFQPGNSQAFNFLDYEATRKGAGSSLTYELVNILQIAMNGGRDRGGSQNPFWDDAVAQLLTNSIDLVLMATGRLSLDEIVDVIRSAPTTLQDARTIRMLSEDRRKERAASGYVWSEESKTADYIRRAHYASKGTVKYVDYREVYQFFVKEWPMLDFRTRSNILASLMTRLTGLLRTPFRQLFCGTTSVTPDDSFEGKVIILNLPVKEYGEVGRFAQILFKTVWQRAVERRGTIGRPVFLWADEAQFFVTKYDMQFQQTARSSRAASVYLTQSVVNFRASLDSSNSNSISDSLMGNLQTKIFHANACPLTNEYAERLFGQELQSVAGYSSGPSGFTGNVAKTMLPILPAIKMTLIRKGGQINNRAVDGYVFQAGRIWKGNDGKHNKNWILSTFMQDDL